MASTARDLIKTKLGGPEAVAEVTNKTPGAVRMWIHRQKIPREVWPELLEAYPNLTLRDLRAMEREGRT